ncbi:hypothetical protein ERJ70_13110 [Sediminibacillus dalangtanensis]|uniref:DUF3993 domain-containing protein n=1 Tax=Sediminibacillus dalangtanensis TaxID=2729421 RepID=A0ABX7W030_9BACI|nr:hypothetical protein [Sediminibacillus dalangtanensis]QTN00153.1 hypothetical protein ERJ70_13110 [Sediminibacillus dalangtanensis]
MRNKAVAVLAMCVLILIIPILILSGQAGDEEMATAGSAEQISQENVPSDSETASRPTHAQLVSITEKFMDLLVQETDESYRVRSYNSINELTDAFTKIAKPSAAKKYIDYYYEEKEDGLYLLPAETPPWFQSEAEYEMIESGDGTVKVIQENQTELHGSYTLELELTYDDSWKITETKHS